MDNAQQLLATYFPNASLKWFGGDEHGERRVDAFLVGQGTKARPYYVTSLRIDGCFVSEAVSAHYHLPYDPHLIDVKPHPSVPGVSVTTWTIHPPCAVEARFIQRGDVRIAPVIAGHCALFDWNVIGMDGDSCLTADALFIKGVWQPTVSRLVAATATEFVRAYAAYRDTKQASDSWAVDAFFDAGSFADKLRMVESVLDTPDVSDWCLGCLAAGPVEDLIGCELLDLLERDATMRARWIPLLRGTYWQYEPREVRRRLSAMLGLSPPPV